MNEPKHTPGKWDWMNVAIDNVDCIIVTAFKEADNPQLIAQLPFDDYDAPTQAANARLMVTAPELYAACKAAQKSLLGFCQSLAGVTDLSADVDALNQLEAAIAEAEKETT